MEKYSLILVKSTRKPIILNTNMDFDPCSKLAINFYNQSNFLHNNKLASSGISYLIISDKYISQIKDIEIGSPSYFNIPVIWQIGSY